MTGPGLKDIARAGREIFGARGRRLPSSTLYDTLNPMRMTLPPLRIVEMVVRACRGDVETWVAAWQDIAMRDFEAENPPLPAEREAQNASEDPAQPRLVVVTGDAPTGTRDQDRPDAEVRAIPRRGIAR